MPGSTRSSWPTRGLPRSVGVPGTTAPGAGVGVAVGSGVGVVGSGVGTGSVGGAVGPPVAVKVCTTEWSTAPYASAVRTYQPCWPGSTRHVAVSGESLATSSKPAIRSVVRMSTLSSSVDSDLVLACRPEAA